MSFLPFGRLFWKFLVFFFLAQVTAVLGIGLAIWIWTADRDFGPSPNEPPPFAAPRPERPGEPPPELRRFPPPPRARIPVAHLLTGALVSLVFAGLLAAYVARPIRRLRHALQMAANGQLTPGAGAAMGNRRDELADLGRDFDRMAQHLAQLMQSQRRLLHDVSHELRSPLARLNAIIGLMRQQPGRLDDCLSRLEHESSRMDRLLSELLTLSRLESRMQERANEAVDLSELLADVVEDAAPEAELAGCRVELAVGRDVIVAGDPEMLHRVFDNLLRNALAYAHAGGWIGITASSSAEAATIRVEDRGPGVSGFDLERLFVPFFRCAPTPDAKGYGLGLAIARQVVENHGGRIEAANRPEGGLCMTVTLPCGNT